MIARARVVALVLGARAFEGAGFEVSDEIDACVGLSLISTVGQDRATELVAEPDLTKLSDGDQALAAAALDECVSGEVTAATDEAWMYELFGECSSASLSAAALAASLGVSLRPVRVACVMQKLPDAVDFNDFADADPAVQAEHQAAISDAVLACPAS